MQNAFSADLSAQSFKSGTLCALQQVWIITRLRGFKKRRTGLSNRVVMNMYINNKFVDLVQMLWLFLYKFPFTQSVKMIMDEH